MLRLFLVRRPLLLARLIGFAHLDLLQAAEGVPAQGEPRGVSDPEVAAAALQASILGNELALRVGRQR